MVCHSLSRPTNVWIWKRFINLAWSSNDRTKTPPFNNSLRNSSRLTTKVTKKISPWEQWRSHHNSKSPLELTTSHQDYEKIRNSSQESDYNVWPIAENVKNEIVCYNPHSTVILKEYFENIPLKSCNIAKIFVKLLERFLKYCRNLAMSVQNIINGILL